MKKNNINNLIEYLNLTLIISYFFIHNIILVLIGITLSIYLININFIRTMLKSINTKEMTRKTTLKSNKYNKAVENDPNKIKLIKEDSRITLVEEIEELGFIPSLEENDDSNVA